MGNSIKNTQSVNPVSEIKHVVKLYKSEYKQNVFYMVQNFKIKNNLNFSQCRFWDNGTYYLIEFLNSHNAKQFCKFLKTLKDTTNMKKFEQNDSVIKSYEEKYFFTYRKRNDDIIIIVKKRAVYE